MTEGLEGNTLANVLIGFVVTIVVGVIPGLNLIAVSVGAGVGGYLQNEGVNGGAKVGLGVSVAFMLILLPVLALAGGFIVGLIPGNPEAMDILAGAGALIGFVAVVAFVFLVVMGVIGGVIGGAIAGSQDS